MFSDTLLSRAENLLSVCRSRGVKISTAESCTGGLIAALFTSIPGSSDIFDRGFITYSNQSKIDELGVDQSIIKAHGEVSGECAEAMALGVIQHSTANLAIAVTGIAGPGGGTEEKPVGTVYLAICERDGAVVVRLLKLSGNRNRIRIHTVLVAVNMLVEYLASM